MAVTYRESRILAKASELRPGDIDRLNKILHDAGLGRPLRPPEASASAAGGSGLVVLPVVGADPMAVRDAVRAAAGKDGGKLTALSPDFVSSAGTAEDGVFFAAGKKSGHGTIGWLPAPSYEMPASQPWRDLPRRPVIALLDSGVQPHDWLPGGGGPPFVLDAEEYGWPAPALDEDAPTKVQPGDPSGSHWGHGTFIAGLIHLAAPDAQVLSMRVMDGAGQVCDSAAAGALNWLADTPESAGGVDINIVLMAFGRQVDSGEHDLANIKAPIQKLSDRGVRIVASAGNDGSERTVYPAAFAVEPGLSVVSVGALAGLTERSPSSNFGPWVREWRKGTNIISIMPLTTKDIGEDRLMPWAGFGPYFVSVTGNGYAWWNGTSFAAAIYAGTLARQGLAGEALPEPVAGP